MPFRKKYGTKRRRRRRATRSSRTTRKVGKKLLSDARRPGTNSSLEKAVKLIAKKEALKLLPPNLIFRRMILADYTRATNAMVNYTPIGWDGVVIALAQIPMEDSQTLAIGALPPQVNDPSLRPNPVYPYGVNLITPMETGLDGFRSGRKVSIKNIVIGIRTRVDPFAEGAPNYEHAFLKWRVVTVSDDAMSGVAWEPQPDRLLRMRTFGFSGRLDVDELQNTSLLKTRTLMKGTIKLTYNKDHVVETQREKFLKCNIPVEYANNDAYGQQVTSQQKLFLVLRSNIPQADLVNHPQCAGYYKLGYKNVT